MKPCIVYRIDETNKKIIFKMEGEIDHIDFDFDLNNENTTQESIRDFAIDKFIPAYREKNKLLEDEFNRYKIGGIICTSTSGNMFI